MKNAKNLLALLAGATVGAAVVLLVAPKSGKEFRDTLWEDISRRLDDWLATLEDRLAEPEEAARLHSEKSR